MGETGYIVPLLGTLDPTAEEFTPFNRIPFPAAVGVPFFHFTADVAQFSTSSTRSLLLSPVPPISETALRKDLELFGDVRAVQTESLRYGIVTVHFYDIRHAETAFTAIRNHYLHCAVFFNFFSQHPQFFAEPPPPGIVAGCPLWPQFVLPTAGNHGTIVVFNLDSSVSAFHLRQVFETFGPIKEVRGTPWKKNQRFIEYFDTRDAAMALNNMNGKEVYGKQVVIEFGKPGRGGYGRRRFYKGPFNFNNMQTGSVVASMGSLSLNGGVGNRNVGGEEMEQHRSQSMAVESTEEQVPRRRHWKGKQTVKNHETTRKLDAAIVESSASRDFRTTVMIKNIPNKYSRKQLLKKLDNHCISCNEQIGDGEPLSSYDFVYLPIDFNNKCNVGYGFVNMTSPEATMRLYKAFHLQRWEVFNSRKICEITYARVQGLEALKEHFKNSRFPWEMEHYLPVVFSPPRDGRREVTEAVPIVERMGNRHRSSIDHEEVDESSGCGGDHSKIVGAGFPCKSGGVGCNNHNDDDDTSGEEKEK